MKDNICHDRLRSTGVIICAMILFFVGVLVTPLGCDYAQHIMEAENITFEKLAHPIMFIEEYYYPLWHLAVKILIWILRIPSLYVAEIINGLFTVISFLGIYCFFNYKSGKLSGGNVFFSFLCCLVGPLYLPWYNKYYFIGQDSPNVWHSPTAIIIKAISIFVFILLLMFLDDKRENKTKVLFRMSGLLLLANLAKPNFTQILYPTLFCFCVGKTIKTRGEYIRTSVGLLLCCIPSFIYMLFQFIVAFFHSTDAGGMRIAFMKYWNYEAPNAIISIFLAIAFPLMVAIRMIKNNEITDDFIFAWGMLIWGIIEKALLIEEGVRMYAGNFAWGYSLALLFVWVISIFNYNRVYFENTKEKTNNVLFYIETILLGFHLLFGLWYIYSIIIRHNVI